MTREEIIATLGTVAVLGFVAAMIALPPFRQVVAAGVSAAIIVFVAGSIVLAIWLAIYAAVSR